MCVLAYWHTHTIELTERPSKQIIGLTNFLQESKSLLKAEKKTPAYSLDKENNLLDMKSFNKRDFLIMSGFSWLLVIKVTSTRMRLFPPALHCICEV